MSILSYTVHNGRELTELLFTNRLERTQQTILFIGAFWITNRQGRGSRRKAGQDVVKTVEFLMEDRQETSQIWPARCITFTRLQFRTTAFEIVTCFKSSLGMFET